MPDRYHKVVKTLATVKNQTYPFDAIYLALPHKSRRLDIPYPDPTDEMKSLATIVRCTDYGPITKIVGALLMESDPETVIVTFDDDMIYSPHLVEALLKRHYQYPNSAIGSSGMLLKYSCPMCAITPNEDNFLYRIPKFAVPEEGRRVDSIYGYPGALYCRAFFPSTLPELEEQFLSYALVNKDTLLNDDIIISGYLSLHGIERRIFPNMPLVSFVLDAEGKRSRLDNEISYDLDKFFQRMNAAIAEAKKMGMYQTNESLDISETIIGICAIVVICILTIGGIVYYLLVQ